jgi:hypothetical protein
VEHEGDAQVCKASADLCCVVPTKSLRNHSGRQSWMLGHVQRISQPMSAEDLGPSVAQDCFSI